MSHEIEATDTMFSANGETPWHGLGTVVAGQVTSAADALRLSGLGWTVSLAELQTVPNGHASQAVESHKAVRRDDTGAVLGVVGNAFRPLQNDRAFAAFDKWADAGVLSYETAGSLRDGRRVWILAKLCVPDLEIGKGDVVNPYALLAHGHDGTLAIRIKATCVRVVCANTLAAAMLDRAVMRSFRHVGDVDGKADEALASLDNVRAAAAQQAAVYRSLAAAGMPTNPRKQADAVLDYLAAVWETEATALAKQSESGNGRAVDVWDLFAGGGKGSDLASAAGTYWGMYQALAEYVTHTRGRGGAEGRAESSIWGEGANVLRRGIAVAWAMGRDKADPAELQTMPTDAIEATIASSMGRAA